MATLPVKNTFTLIPEGTHVFKIEDVIQDDEFGKMTIKLVTAQGLHHNERFNYRDANGEYNERALNAFSYFAKTALNNYGITEIEPMDLVGHYIRAEVIHHIQPNKNKPGETVTFVNLGTKSVANGFDTEQVDNVKSEPKKGLDLNALLD